MLKVASECKEAFAELQTDINAAPLGAGEVGPQIPFLTYKDYASQVLFPNAPGHPALRELEVEPARAPAMEKGLRQFNQLLMNKTFLLIFVRTLEANRYFMTKDRSAVGSLLMVILQERLEYCTEVLKHLLGELMERTLERKLQPKILFRRSESVAERMLSAWFTFLMHGYLEEAAGEPLFLLYWAIKRQLDKGPVDALTLEARYSLSEEKLLRQSLDFSDVTLYVSGPLNGAAPPLELPVRVLDCDTISQVKEKALDELFRTSPHSLRPAVAELDLEWRSGAAGRLLLQDLDASTKVEPGGWKRLNTLAHYKVPNNATLALLHRQASHYNLSLLSDRSDKSSTFSLPKASPTLARAFSPHQTAALLPHHQPPAGYAALTGTTGSRGGGPDKDSETGYKLYHLVKPNDHAHLDNEREKLVSEIYLTRLLYTKGTLQRFMEDLLDAIFSTAHRSGSLPLAVKYMFDFFDEQAAHFGISDPDVVHAWKSNALPLRFWVNLIKNPHFVFDIPRLPKVPFPSLPPFLLPTYTTVSCNVGGRVPECGCPDPHGFLQHPGPPAHQRLALLQAPLRPGHPPLPGVGRLLLLRHPGTQLVLPLPIWVGSKGRRCWRRSPPSPTRTWGATWRSSRASTSTSSTSTPPSPSSTATSTPTATPSSPPSSRTSSPGTSDSPTNSPTCSAPWTTPLTHSTPPTPGHDLTSPALPSPHLPTPAKYTPPSSFPSPACPAPAPSPPPSFLCHSLLAHFGPLHPEAPSFCGYCSVGKERRDARSPIKWLC